MLKLSKPIFPVVAIFLFIFISPVKGELFSGTSVLDISQGDGFDFSSGRLNSDEDADLLVGLDDDGNPTFLPPTVIKDMGEISMEEVREAPHKGEYSDGTSVKKGHTYCIVTKGNHYVKFFVDEKPEDAVMKITIRWVYQSDGSRELNSRAGVITSTTWGKIKALFR